MQSSRGLLALSICLQGETTAMAQHADLVILVRWRYDSADAEVGSTGEAVVCLDGEPAARYHVGASWKQVAA